MTDETTNGWVKLYHTSGAQVTFPVSLMAAITTEQALNAYNSVNTLLGAGFSVNLPGLNDGELVEEVTAVARRAGNDGTPIVAFFVAHPKMVKKFIHTYLDTPDEVSAFENATGLRLAAIPVFESDKDITKDHRMADRYIVNLPHPIKLVYKFTDRWKQWEAAGGNGQQPQKYELIRYMSNGNSAPASAPAPAGTAPDYSQVKTPGGLLVSSLTDDKLHKLAHSQAENVTPEMRAAATHYLQHPKAS